MTGQYAFSFDARFCSGCKACQAACKDKNNLPVGVLWRRVIEVSGGEWRNVGNGSASPVWENTVFAYNLSMSCNHCVHPKCAGVCPVEAYEIRGDGIVILDSAKCVGCGYCAWACPYGSPQYNPVAGYMTKCDFCHDNLEQGVPPACVAACPMRVLDYGQGSTANGIALWDVPPAMHPFPLPSYSHTQPRLAVQPHPAFDTTEKKNIANLEELQPHASSIWQEIPLMLYTLLGQMSVGAYWAMLWSFPPFWALAEGDVLGMRLLPLLVVGFCLAMAALSSLAHLGTRKNAWRVLSNLRKSWLSREILFTVLFGAGWFFTTWESLLPYRMGMVSNGITAALGLGLVYSMSQVYRLPAAPGWNSWKTNAGFLISTLLLGQSLMNILLVHILNFSNTSPASHQVTTNAGVLIILLLVQLGLSPKRTVSQVIRLGMIVAAIILASISFIFPVWQQTLTSLLMFVMVMAEETLGRWQFYQSRLGA